MRLVMTVIFQGKGVIAVMENAKDNMNEVSGQMIHMKDIERCKYSNGETTEVCDDCQHALTVWDFVFAYCQLPNPGEFECDKA